MKLKKLYRLRALLIEAEEDKGMSERAPTATRILRKCVSAEIEYQEDIDAM